MLLEQNSDGVGFLAGGTTADPDPDDASGRLVGKDARDDRCFKLGKGKRVAEKVCDADQQIAKECLHLLWSLLKIFDVAVQPFYLVDSHAPLDTTLNGTWLVERKIMTGLGTQDNKYFLQFALCFWFRDAGRSGRSAEGMNGIRHKLGRHICSRKDIIHQPGADSTARHTVILGGFRDLNHRHATFTFYRAETHGAVTAGAGKHDADC